MIVSSISERELVLAELIVGGDNFRLLANNLAREDWELRNQHSFLSFLVDYSGEPKSITHQEIGFTLVCWFIPRSECESGIPRG